MQEEKLIECNGLDEGERLVLRAIRAILEVLQEEDFAEAAIADKKVSVLIELPGGGWHLADIVTVLTDAIRTKERTCTGQHLGALVETLDETIVAAQSLGVPP